MHSNRSLALSRVGAYGYGLYQDEIDEYLASDDEIYSLQVSLLLLPPQFLKTPIFDCPLRTLGKAIVPFTGN